ncbi:MAG TPA: MBL fold metallo-hydrolase [Thermoanaerobaculia bacterium]|nr:MBL fold metallo-hydrolase [Thermoanaerobaculia bacterium]
MAQLAARLPTNAPGDFYVDSSCIDCDACRQIAPGVFHDTGEQSAVYHQPDTAEELLAAQKALIACPTSSIGSMPKHDMRKALSAYPELIAEDVYRCGFTSESSFGAFSYLIRHANGNILVDSPRFAGPLVKNMAGLGGATRMLLTHADDVADHAKFHERFGCARVLHRDDVRSRTAAIEWKPSGIDPIPIEPDLLMIPTPGHTRGHAVYLYRDKFLFTGDHLAWNVERERLCAFRSACWYSWSEQIKSMERLLGYRFEWVLPGHGRPIHLEPEQMHDELAQCVEWMKVRADAIR